MLKENTTMIQCATYGRASTDRQGDTIEHQISWAKEWIKRENQDKTKNEIWKLPDELIYTDEAFSGYKLGLLDRPAMKRLINDAKQDKFHLIIFKSISRIARDTQESLKLLSIFETLGIRVISIEETFDSSKQSSEFFFTIHSAIAQEESKKIGVRVSLGNKAKARSGKWANSRPPMGYKVNKETKKLEFGDSEQIKIIQDIFDLYVNEGLGTFKIAEFLNNGNRFTTRGNKWSRASVVDIIKNRAYVGDIVYGKKRYKPVQKLDTEGKMTKTINIDEADWSICENAHPPIVDRIIFDKAQMILKSRNVGQTFKHVIHPLTGILKCGKCGEGMVCQKRVWNNKEYRYYICKTYHKYGRDTCSQANINADELENLIYNRLKEKVVEFQKRKSNQKDKLIFAKQNKSDLEKKLNKLNKEIDKSKRDSLNLLKMAEHLSEEQFKFSNDELKKELNNLLDKKQILEEEILNLKSEDNMEYLTEIMNQFLKEKNPDLRKYFHMLINEIKLNEKVDPVYKFI